MQRLYLNNYIKKEKIPEALHYAKLHKHLLGVDDHVLDSFLEEFEEVIAQREGRFHDKIDYNEVVDIINIIGKNHSDPVNDRQLQMIASILLNKDFQF